MIKMFPIKNSTGTEHLTSMQKRTIYLYTADTNRQKTMKIGVNKVIKHPCTTT